MTQIGYINMPICPFAGSYHNKTSTIEVQPNGKVSFDSCTPEVFIVFENKKWTLKHLTDKQYKWTLDAVKNESICWVRGKEQVTWLKKQNQNIVNTVPVIPPSPVLYSHSPSYSPNPNYSPNIQPSFQPTFQNNTSPQFSRLPQSRSQPIFTRSASPQPMMNR
eukprot:UN24294